MDDLDKVILWEGAKRLAWIIGLGLLSAAIMFFAVVGVYDALWNVPAKNEQIAELIAEHDAWRSRVEELDQYITLFDKEKKAMEAQYRVACNFDSLFMLIADPDQIIDFEALEEYIKNKKAFFKRVSVKK